MSTTMTRRSFVKAAAITAAKAMWCPGSSRVAAPTASTATVPAITAPTVTINANAEATLGSIGAGDVIFSPDFVYNSRTWFSPFNDDNGNGRLTQGPNARVNLSLSWETSDFALRAWVSNAMNARTYMYGINLRDSFGYDYLLPSAPRTYGVSARYRF